MYTDPVWFKVYSIYLVISTVIPAKAGIQTFV